MIAVADPGADGGRVLLQINAGQDQPTRLRALLAFLHHRHLGLTELAPARPEIDPDGAAPEFADLHHLTVTLRARAAAATGFIRAASTL